jgi:Holliday junction resolvase RusA-like endonuclease
MTIIEFEVPGVPRPQPRPRTRVAMPKRGGRAFAQIYNPDTNKYWKRCMVTAARSAMLRAAAEGRLGKATLRWDQAVRVDVEAFFDPPAWMAKWLERRGAALECSLPMLEKPDRDNLDKVVLDVLTQEGWWADDSHVYVGKVGKWYVRPGYTAGVKIRVQFEELHPEYLAIRRAHAGKLAKAKAKRSGEDDSQMRIEELGARGAGRGRGGRGGRISSEDAREAGLIP